MYTILLLGSGGREHAFAYKIAQSPKLTKLFIAPGNAGTSQYGENVAVGVNDFDSIRQFVLENNVNMLVVGPEDPLVNGIHDYFLADSALKNIPVIGPKKDGAMLEGSKDFSKQFMFRNGVPSAASQTFSAHSLPEGYAFLESLKPPYVLKADGLAAGKGVLIIDNLTEAKSEFKNMLDGKFGSASAKVVIEEFLKGIELSVFVLTDGKSYKLLPAAKDYKRIGEADTGLNTGGMGAVSPVAFADDEFLKKVETQVVIPTIDGLRKEGIDYRGFIFIGLMNDNGTPKVIEYNCRMGDPETEAVLPRIQSDIVDLFEGVARQTLHEKSYETTLQTAVTVVLVSGGYPGDYEKHLPISGIPDHGETLIFHSGTTHHNAQLLTNGGRVFALTSFGNTIAEAVDKSLKTAAKIQFSGKYFRHDIGQDLMKIGK